MVALTRELREALMRVKKDPQLAPFVAYLRAELIREQTSMMGLDAPGVYRAQGRASYVFDLIRFIDGVDDYDSERRNRTSQTIADERIPLMRGAY